MRLENRRLLLNASFFGSLLLPIAAFGQVSCLALNTHPDVDFHPHVSEFTAALMPTTNPNRCEVEFTFSSEGGPEAGYEIGERERIRIRVGLPLNSLEGGSGGVQGAWNGKTRGLGGGYCAGAVGAVTSATDAGYVGSSTDTGHTGATAFDCSFAMQLNPVRLNRGRLKDFIEDSLVAQVRWSKIIAAVYYGTAPVR